MEVHIVHRLENQLPVAGTLGLEAVDEFRNSDVDAPGCDLLLVSCNLRGKGLGRENAIEQRLATELNDTSDELGFGVGVEGLVKRIALVLPQRAAVETEPDERVHADASLPGGLYNCIVVTGFRLHLVGGRDASTVKADVAAVELFADVLEVGGEFTLALA